MIDVGSPTRCETHWPAVIIGGGPAGAAAASRLAGRGVRTLLVEAKPRPLGKVCGGCLNERAIAGLVHCGLGDALASTAAAPTHAVELRAGGRTLLVPTPSGLAVTRARLDDALLGAAAERGAEVWRGVRATVLPATCRAFRELQLRDGRGVEWRLGASVVVAADGLGAPSLSKLPEFATRAEEGSRIGCGVLLPPTAVEGLKPGHILMAAGEHGYVGVVYCEDGQLNAAAAFDPHAVASVGSLGRLARRTLLSAGVKATPDIEHAAWKGTRRLTQSIKNVAGERVLVVGDAAAYVEPFTGEGMAWAIEDAADAVPIVERGVEQWSGELTAAWRRRCSAQCRARQRAIRTLSWLLRRPWATRLALRAAAASPQLGGRIARSISST